MRRSPFILAILTAALPLLAARPVQAVQPRGSFLMTSGRDTVAMEAVQRTSGRVAATLVFKLMSARIDWDAAVLPDGSVSRMEVAYRKATDGPDAKPQQSATLTFDGDSAFAAIHGGATQRLKTRAGAMPFINPSMALVELLALAHAPAVGARDSAALFLVTGGATVPVVLTHPVRDTVVVALAGVSFRLGVDGDGYVTGGRVPEQGLSIVAGGPLPEAVLAVPKADYSAPADAPYTAENVTVPTRGAHTLAGTLTLPKGAHGRVPCVVTITGSGPQDRDESISIVQGFRPFRQIADALARHGIATLRCDDRGTGESGGAFAAATSEDFAHDVEDALAWLRRDSRIDPARLGLVGHSEGGLIGPWVASRDRALRALVVMAGPSYDGRRIIAYQNGYGIDRLKLAPAARDSAVRAAAAELDSSAAKSPWLRFFLDYDPLPTARRVLTPTLILQGAKDWQVTPVQAGELASAMRAGGNRDVTVHVLPDVDHLFLHDPSGDPGGYAKLPVRAIDPAILEELSTWVTKRMK